ncbi:MAG: hypothetical protein HYZ28_26765 [Myxococcales bacterium]|nr:hypothetical protein [Myxococcales bacterium]
MLAMAKMVAVAMVLVMPGGVFAICAYFLARAAAVAYRKAQLRSGRAPTLRAIAAELSFRSAWREARASL